MKLLNRVRPLVQVLSSLVVLTVVVNGLLQVLSAASVLTWPPKVLAGNGFLDDSRQRVRGAVEEYSQGRIGPEERLGAFVGISNLREDVDLKTVADVAGTGWRFVGLAGAGFAMSDVNPYAELLLTSELRPDLVVVGIGVHQLVDTRPKPGAFNAGFVEYLRRGDWRNTAIAVRGWFWFYTRRQDINMAAESSVLDARERLFRRWDVHVHEQRADRHSPWREMIKSDWPEHFSSNTLQEQETFFEGLGVFEGRTYANSPKATAVLIKAIDRFRSRGAKVVLLLMPQHSRLMERIPATALDTLTATMKQKYQDQPLPILDFRSVVDDDGFVDLPHLNRKGSAKFSRLMAGQLRPLLPNALPLMKMSDERDSGRD
jgi:hypothetical protein